MLSVCAMLRVSNFGEKAGPNLPHSCALHRNPVRPSPWAQKTLLRRKRVNLRADARWLDSCDRHRNEGGKVSGPSVRQRCPAAYCCGLG